jgi:phosphatidylglycerophosphate synthase
LRALPLVLTLLRIPLAALVWVKPGCAPCTLTLMVIAGVSDVLDGALARWVRRREGREGERDAGAWLDPLCDKIFVVSALLSVFVSLRPPVWMVLLIAARELAQVPLVAFLRFRGVVRTFDFRAALIGKLATVLQFGAVAAILFRHPSQAPLAVAAGVLGLASSLYYFLRAARTSPGSPPLPPGD